MHGCCETYPYAWRTNRYHYLVLGANFTQQQLPGRFANRQAFTLRRRLMTDTEQRLDAGVRREGADALQSAAVGGSLHGYATPKARAAIRSLLGLLLLVNLSMSVYQLPLNRVIERRLCREYYAEHGPAVLHPGQDLDEQLCKVDAVQKELAWIQGAMETAWIIGGQ
jgi:hypothetical protein